DEMMKAQKETVGMSAGGRPAKTGLNENPVSVDPKPAPLPTLKQAGIDKNLAHEARQLGKLSDAEFDNKAEEAKANVRAPKKERTKTDRQLMRDYIQQQTVTKTCAECEKYKKERDDANQTMEEWADMVGYLLETEQMNGLEEKVA